MSNLLSYYWDLPRAFLTLMCGWEGPNVGTEHLIMIIYSYMLMIYLLSLTMLRMSFERILAIILSSSKSQSNLQICTLADIRDKLHLIMEWKHGLLNILNTFILQWRMYRSTLKRKGRSLSLQRDTWIYWLATIVQTLISFKNLIHNMCHTISPWLGFSCGYSSEYQCIYMLKYRWYNLM